MKDLFVDYICSQETYLVVYKENLHHFMTTGAIEKSLHFHKGSRKMQGELRINYIIGTCVSVRITRRYNAIGQMKAPYALGTSMYAYITISAVFSP